MRKKKEVLNERPNESDSSRRSPSATDHPADTSLADDGWFDLGEDRDPLLFMDGSNDDALDLGDVEDSFSLSPFGFSTFDQAAQSDLSNLKKRRRSNLVVTSKRTREQTEITEDDFEDGPERKAFQLIRHYADILFLQEPNALTKQSLIFFFGCKLQTEIRFDLCCDVLGARAEVIRLRFMYEWWKRGTIFTGPLDFDTAPYPDLLTGEILHHGNIIGVELAREIWLQPGITTADLYRVLGVELDDSFNPIDQEGNAIKHALEQLNEQNIISKNSGWYLTGRNPMLAQMREQSRYGRDVSIGGSYYWSRYFF